MLKSETLFIDFLKKFIKLEYKGDTVTPYVHFKMGFKFNRKTVYRMLYGRRRVVHNKVVFDNYMGRPFGCNCKYVVNKLLEKYPGQLDIVWTVTKKEMANADFPDGVRIVKYGSSNAKEEYATAKVWVSNYHKISYVKRGMYRKPNQFFVQMWHGSLGIKKIENNVPSLTEDKNWLLLAQESSEMTTHWISNSAFETDVYKKAFWNVENVLEFGHPRNDILINGDPAITEKVKRFYEIEGKRVMFYAPTFREDYRLDCYQLDYPQLKSALEAKFGGEWVFVVRMHPRIKSKSALVLPESEYIYDATFYPDIQELLLCADCMISDYSSCIFDFMLTRRPAFVFATDIEEFDNERGFYYPLESTPFPIATDNGMLLHNIHCFDKSTYTVKLEQFLNEKGCVEDGQAAERVADLVMELARR